MRGPGRCARSTALSPGSSAPIAWHSPRAASRFVVTCPRYDRVIIYQVGAQKKLETINEIELAGRPVAVAALADRFLVLERPPGDQRHVEPRLVGGLRPRRQSRRRVGTWPATIPTIWPLRQTASTCS